MISPAQTHKSCIALIVLSCFVASCSGEEEKPRPDFMSGPVSETVSKASVEARELASDTAKPGDEAAAQVPRAIRDRITEPTHDDDDTRGPTIVIVEDPSAREEDRAGSDDSVSHDANAYDEVALDPQNEDEEEDEQDETDPPSEENGRFFYGSTRPFVPRPVDLVDPPGAQSLITANDPPEPSAAVLAKVTAPWEPTPMDELESILDREKVYITAEDREALKRYGEIPTPPDPTPPDHP